MAFLRTGCVDEFPSSPARLNVRQFTFGVFWVPTQACGRTSEKKTSHPEWADMGAAQACISLEYDSTGPLVHSFSGAAPVRFIDRAFSIDAYNGKCGKIGTA